MELDEQVNTVEYSSEQGLRYMVFVDWGKDWADKKRPERYQFITHLHLSKTVETRANLWVAGQWGRPVPERVRTFKLDLLE